MRYQYFDIFRGLCILLMILFHLNYSLVHIFDLQILNISQNFWYVLGRVSALGFMVIAGASYFLATKKYSRGDLQVKYLRYAGVLGFLALCITGLTYFLLPEQLILFGILHLFSVSFLLLPLVTRTYIRAIIVLGVIIILSYFTQKQVMVEYLFPLGWHSESFYSADYYPLIPYFGYILAGYLLTALGDKYDMLRLFLVQRNLNIGERVFSYMGKRSLLIYLVHQPIIIGMIWLILKYL